MKTSVLLIVLLTSIVASAEDNKNIDISSLFVVSSLTVDLEKQQHEQGSIWYRRRAFSPDTTLQEVSDWFNKNGKQRWDKLEIYRQD